MVVRESARDRLVDAAARAALEAELQEHCKARMSKHKYPRFVTFVDDLPRNDRGKIDRRALLRREADGE